MILSAKRPRIRLNSASARPTRKRRTSNESTWSKEVELYAIPKGILRGDATILDRMMVRWMDDNKITYSFQNPVSLPTGSVRVDFAIYNIGFIPFMGLEADGAIFHQDYDADRERDLLLYAEGITNVHIFEADMLESFERFDYVMKRALTGDQLPRPPQTIRTIVWEK